MNDMGMWTNVADIGQLFNKVPARVELAISCLLGRRFDQLSHQTSNPRAYSVLKTPPLVTYQDYK